MVSPLFFYELGLIALVWLFLMLCWLGPNAAVRRQPIAPSPPRVEARDFYPVLPKVGKDKWRRGKSIAAIACSCVAF